MNKATFPTDVDELEMKWNVSDILSMEIYGDSQLRFIEEDFFLHEI